MTTFQVPIASNLSSIKRLPTYQRFKYHYPGTVLNQARCQPNDEPLIDARTQVKTAYFENVPDANIRYLLRRDCALKLATAANQLSQIGLQLELVEGYRSLEQQRFEFNHISAMIRQQHPDATPEQVIELTEEFSANPDLNPPHTTGGAVDVRLRDYHSGELIDMGTDINTISPLAYTDSPDIDDTAKSYRKLLRLAMIQANFAPLSTEWWHFETRTLLWAAVYDSLAYYQSC
ncbi:hypothetical protein D5085_08385 [Ectothiorhodospiraceae bacterium BW-2]|nr:hypothetical protein D5085_08385 [Ectothiorhodospiraceae bacterium BW-2]